LIYQLVQRKTLGLGCRQRIHHQLCLFAIQCSWHVIASWTFRFLTHDTRTGPHSQAQFSGLGQAEVVAVDTPSHVCHCRGPRCRSSPLCLSPL